MQLSKEWLQDWLKKHHPGLQLLSCTDNYASIRCPLPNGLGRWVLTINFHHFTQDQLATLLLAFP